MFNRYRANDRDDEDDDDDEEDDEDDDEGPVRGNLFEHIFNLINRHRTNGPRGNFEGHFFMASRNRTPFNGQGSSAENPIVLDDDPPANGGGSGNSSSSSSGNGAVINLAE